MCVPYILQYTVYTVLCTVTKFNLLYQYAYYYYYIYIQCISKYISYTIHTDHTVVILLVYGVHCTNGLHTKQTDCTLHKQIAQCIYGSYNVYTDRTVYIYTGPYIYIRTLHCTNGPYTVQTVRTLYKRIVHCTNR